tara:strand:+ start:96 stop:491 length:396 start_codon:yes stop_codon:yes gene_type:complete
MAKTLNVGQDVILATENLGPGFPEAQVYPIVSRAAMGFHIRNYLGEEAYVNATDLAPYISPGTRVVYIPTIGSSVEPRMQVAANKQEQFTVSEIVFDRTDTGPRPMARLEETHFMIPLEDLCVYETMSMVA